MLNGQTSEDSSDVIVLLHGWGMGASVWSRVVPLLTRRYRVVALDLPGYGGSVGVSSVSLDDMARQVAEAAPKGAVWVGWSLGGMVAMQAATLFPDLMSRLVLVASSPRFVQGDGWRHAMAQEQLSLFATGLMGNVDATLKRFVALQFYGQEGVRDVSRELQQAVVGNPVDSAALASGLGVLAGDDLRLEYSRLRLPVQHVYGAMDRLVPVRVKDDLAKLNPTVEQIVLKGVGHAPFVSHPEMFVERLGL